MTLLLPCGCDRTEYTQGAGMKIASELLQIGRPAQHVPEDQSVEPTSRERLGNTEPSPGTGGMA